MRYGYYQRLHPYMVVTKGWNPLETLTAGYKSAPVKSGVTIKSGQVIVLEYVSADSAFEWVLADSAVSAQRAQVPHFALQDSDDHDVVSAGLLTGLSCAGQFELQTGYYGTSGSPPITGGTPLTYGTGGDAGNVITCARGDGPTSPIIGILSLDHYAGPIDLTGKNSSATNLNVVRFATHYNSQNAAS